VPFIEKQVEILLGTDALVMIAFDAHPEIGLIVGRRGNMLAGRALVPQPLGRLLLLLGGGLNSALNAFEPAHLFSIDNEQWAMNPLPQERICPEAF
jgi:hypothetical protein